MKYELNGQAIDITKQQVINGKTYPKGSLLVAAVRQRAGIVSVPEATTADRRWYFVASDGSSEEKSLEMLREQELPKIKQIRQNTADILLSRSSGLSDIYTENVKAVEAIDDGIGATKKMKSGKTADEHVAAMAGNMDVSVDAFIAYIRAEIEAAAKPADEIENEYLRVSRKVIPNATFEEIQTVVADYSAFCEARINPVAEVEEDEAVA